MMSSSYLGEEDSSEPSSSQIDMNILRQSFLPVLWQSFDSNGMLNTEIFRFANVPTFWTKNQLRMLAFFCILDMWKVQNLKRLKARENAFASKIARKGIFSF
jgi:hypothetical protein